MPYLSEDDISLVKQIIAIAVNMAHNDLTVIRAIEKTIEIFKELFNIYKAMVRNIAEMPYSVLLNKKSVFTKHTMFFLSIKIRLNLNGV